MSTLSGLRTSGIFLSPLQSTWNTCVHWRTRIFLSGSWKFKLGSWCLHYDPSAHGLRVYPPELRRRCDKHTRWFASLHLSTETECWCSDQRKKQIWTKWSLCECNFYICRIVSSWMTSVKITYFLSEFPLACLKLAYILCFCSRLFLSVMLFFFKNMSSFLVIVLCWVLKSDCVEKEKKNLV